MPHVGKELISFQTADRATARTCAAIFFPVPLLLFFQPFWFHYVHTWLRFLHLGNGYHQYGMCCQAKQRFINSLVNESVGSLLGSIWMFIHNIAFFLRDVSYCQELPSTWVAPTSLFLKNNIKVADLRLSWLSKRKKRKNLCVWKTWTEFYYKSYWLIITVYMNRYSMILMTKRNALMRKGLSYNCHSSLHHLVEP